MRRPPLTQLPSSRCRNSSEPPQRLARSQPPTTHTMPPCSKNRFFSSTYICGRWRTNITAPIYVTCWVPLTRAGRRGPETPPRLRADCHLRHQDHMDNTILPDFCEIFGDLQDPRKSIAICFNTRAAPTYFINFYKDLTPRCACGLPPLCNFNLCRKSVLSPPPIAI